MRRWLPAYCTVQSVTDILRRLYVTKDTPETAMPWWASLAYERHWISGPEYSRIPRVLTGRITRSIASLLNEPSPLFGLIRKQTSQETSP